MTRGQKKFLYGLFYLAVFALIVWVFIPSGGAPEMQPVVSSNQPVPLRLIGAAQIFKSENSGKGVLLAYVENPNVDYGAAAFSYSFSIFKRDGSILIKVLGDDKIYLYPDEKRYVVSGYDLSGADILDVQDKIDFEIVNADFHPSSQFLAPDLILSSGPEIATGTLGLTISGKVKNRSAITVGEMKVTALIENRYGDPVFAGQTLLNQLGGFEEREFSVYFPADQALITEAVARKPEIFLNGE
jgi:hypothetical protein